MARYIDNPIIHILAFILAAIAVELYFFPFQPYETNINSKTVFAVLGLCVAGVETARKGYGFLRTDLLVLSGFAILVSLCTFLSLTINTTYDSTYLLYIISMWVWLSAAYFTLWIVKMCLGSVSIKTLTYLIVAVCIFECVTALGVELNPTIHGWVNSVTDHKWVESVKRLHGLSAELDTAGIHFSVALIMLSYVIIETKEESSTWVMGLLWLLFITITVIGNMIARTTLAGVIIGLLYIVWKSFPQASVISPGQLKMFRVLGMILVISLPLVIYFYNNNPVIHKNIRFAFEGFFSLLEKGRWEVASNNTLRSMVVWPDNLHTWLIGDGYIVNPKDDPYYIGEVTRGYYKNTDVGYLRFIFYFGLIGLSAFASFIIMSARACFVRLPKYKLMILLLLLLNFVVWIKVSTDLFFIFALLLSVDIIQEDTGARKLLSEDIKVKV